MEVELRQQHPDTNVGKYWLLHRGQYQKVILYHIYTPAYDSYGWRKKLGEFYAEKMSADFAFEYISVDCRAALDVTKTLDDIFSVIADRARLEFPALF